MKEQIICPQCEHEQPAEVVATGWWVARVHTCENCGYVIMESDWERVDELLNEGVN